jgi:hypothetical protein
MLRWKHTEIWREAKKGNRHSYITYSDIPARYQDDADGIFGKNSNNPLVLPKLRNEFGKTKGFCDSVHKTKHLSG